MRKFVFMLGSAALLSAQVAPAAPKVSGAGPEAVAAYGAKIPEQPYYPPGYRDLRIAAAAQVATFPRDPLNVVSEGIDGEPGTYDVIDCNAEYFDSKEVGAQVAEQSELALEIERIGGELRGLGYRGEIFEEPLLAYERDALAALPEAVAERVAADAALADLAQADAAYAASQSDAGADTSEAAPVLTEAERAEAERAEAELIAAAEAAEAAGRAADEERTETYPEMTEADIAASYGPIGKLALEMESRRARLQPDKPKIIVEGGCGAGEAAFVIRTAPANGKVWLINAFAFHVCMTKAPDPWDLRACRWTEVDPDNATMASGRYMYQARWPDGKTARGARVFEGDFESDEPTRVIIRKN